MKKANLLVVGTGIKLVSHMTVEAISAIKTSEKLFYLVNDPLLEKWLQQKNEKAISLHDIYHEETNRSEAYQKIADIIFSELKTDLTICFVLYGHPMVYVNPVEVLVSKALSHGFKSVILPGISAEDCLFSDLRINPGRHGVQSFDATDFFIREQNFSVNAHLILWQIGYFGNFGHMNAYKTKKKICYLVKYLQEKYGDHYRVIIYEAGMYPGVNPIIKSLMLNELPKTKLSGLSTLYIPPQALNVISSDRLKLLDV